MRDHLQTPADTLRVLVAGVSPTMLRLIVSALATDQNLEVVGTTSNAAKVQSMIRSLSPDMVVVYLEMSKGGGVETFGQLQNVCSKPIVTVSSNPQFGDRNRPSNHFGSGHLGDQRYRVGIDRLGDLPEVLFNAARETSGLPTGLRPKPQVRKTTRFTDKIILVGASTGGVEALNRMLESFPADCPPTLIVQHMPENYSKGFAEHLDEICSASVVLAEDRTLLRSGQVVIAPGGSQHMTLDASGRLKCRLKNGPKINGHSPSVDALFKSAIPDAARTVGIILTGIGQDGAEGLASLREGGARTIGQSRESCVVYGMPRAARDIGAVETELPLDRIAQTALNFCTETASRP